MTLWGANGTGYDLSSSFRFYNDDDVDSDGVLNGDDDCPDEYGLSTVDLDGCPDRDADGVSDDLLPLQKLCSIQGWLFVILQFSSYFIVFY